jgi:hypothetical protein
MVPGGVVEGMVSVSQLCDGIKVAEVKGEVCAVYIPNSYFVGNDLNIDLP